jgi:DNA-binding response OmpR family regulator
MTAPTVLIIEDDPKQANIFAKTFTTCGFDTQVCLRGDEGLNSLEASCPDVIMLDLHLPYVAGPDILAEIRRQERFTNTYVIVATADLYMAKGEVANHADKVLIKPVRFGQLRRVASELFLKKSA